MIIRHWRICKTVKFSKLIYILPYLSIICMKNMSSILMYLNAFHCLRINISCNIRSLIDHQNRLSCCLRLMSKNCSIQSCTYYQIIIHFIIPPSSYTYLK